MEPEITSVNNDIIRMFRSLAAKKGRREAGLYLAEGVRLCEECLLRSPREIAMLLYTRRTEKSRAVAEAARAGLPMRLVAEHAMERACDSQTSQGIACAVRLPRLKEHPDVPYTRMIALEDVGDPGNMGTILRTAWAFGVEGVLLSPGCTDVFAPKAVRAGMGAHFALKLFFPVDFPGALRTLADGGCEMIGAHLMGEESLADAGGKRCVVIGSEARGLSTESTEACTSLYRIPMEGGAESLNAAVAAGILMDRIFHT